MNRFHTFRVTLLSLSSIFLATACGNSNSDGEYPSNFNRIGDAGRTAFIMKNAEPDSVARFVYYGALGKVPGTKIDTIGIAITYVNEKYNSEELDKFFIETENIKSSLPLADKMKIYNMEGYETAEGIGYTLGLEYMGTIRQRTLGVDEIRKEIEDFRKACRKDPETFNRFIIGFKTVLKNDRGKDLPADVYNTFINYN